MKILECVFNMHTKIVLNLILKFVTLCSIYRTRDWLICFKFHLNRTIENCHNKCLFFYITAVVFSVLKVK